MLHNCQFVVTFKTGCLTLLEILEIYWKLAKSPGNFLAESKFFSKPGLIDIGAISPR